MQCNKLLMAPIAALICIATAPALANPQSMEFGSATLSFNGSVVMDRGTDVARRINLVIRNKDRANGDPVFNLYTMHCYDFTSNLAESMKKAIESQVGLSLPPVRSDAERRAP